MSIHTTTTTAALAIVALIVAPATATARPADSQHVTAAVASGARVTSVPQAAVSRNVVPNGDGAGTVTVLAIAGGVLLVGVATGFEGGRVVTRRRTLRL